MTSRNGFTLIEILVVIAVLAGLVAPKRLRYSTGSDAAGAGGDHDHR